MSRLTQFSSAGAEQEAVASLLCHLPVIVLQPVFAETNVDRWRSPYRHWKAQMWTVKTLCRNNGYFLCFLFFWRVVSCDCPDGAHKCLKTGVVAHTTFRWVPYFFRVFCPGVVAQCSYAPHKKGQKVRDTNYT